MTTGRLSVSAATTITIGSLYHPRLLGSLHLRRGFGETVSSRPLPLLHTQFLCLHLLCFILHLSSLLLTSQWT